MKELSQIEDINQVYSEELNEVLVKTPPNLFRIALIIFLVCLLIVIGGSLLIDYDKSRQFDYVLSPTKNGKSFEVVFFTDEDVSQYLSAGMGRLYPQIGSDETMEITMKPDSIQVEMQYLVNQEYSDLTQEYLQDLKNIQHIDTKYKNSVYLSDAVLAKQADAYRVGNIKIVTGKAKLYQVLFNSG